MKALTPRENEVVSGIAAGNPSKVIARELGVSPKTVEKHRSNAMRKLGAHNAADVRRYVLQSNPKHCASCTCEAKP